jgi:imidazoleglycerol-phosphate dehydratase
MQLFEFKELTDSHVKLVRTMKETFVTLELDREKKALEIDTGLHFLNHMVETIAWGACMRIGVKVDTVEGRRLTHAMSEDTGITLGKALRALYDRGIKRGLNGTGSSLFVLDEALARVVIDVAGRRNSFIGLRAKGARLERVEDMLAQDCVAFVEGFSQGLGGTIHLDILKGHDPHHCWECACRAIGEAIRQVFTENLWRTPADNPYFPDEGVAVL